jgi:hypothetical protein
LGESGIVTTAPFTPYQVAGTYPVADTAMSIAPPIASLLMTVNPSTPVVPDGDAASPPSFTLAIAPSMGSWVRSSITNTLTSPAARPSLTPPPSAGAGFSMCRGPSSSSSPQPRATIAATASHPTATHVRLQVSAIARLFIGYLPSSPLRG